MDSKAGLLAAVVANIMWGLFPLYWPLLKPATPIEILAHRIVWSLLFVLALLAASRKVSGLRRLLHDRRAVIALTGAALFQGLNWLTYIYSVNSGQVLQASLGYFITPLLAVLLAVVVLREKLRRSQWFAVGLGTLAVVVLTVDYGHPPWLALVLGCCFAAYGFLKRTAASGAIEGVAIETAVLAGPALAFIVWLGVQGQGTVSLDEPGRVALFVSSGLITMLPLLFFGAAATRLTFTSLGLLQYLAPVLQWVIGVAVVHEPMPLVRLLGFALIWCALVILALDGWLGVRRVVAAAESR
ncbi:MAG TPA: EamA family transporter RarD [Blastococcus sp.]